MWRGRGLSPRALYAVGVASVLLAAGAILIRGTHVHAAPQATPQPPVAAASPRQAREAAQADGAARKAPTVIPGRPVDVAGANARLNLDPLVKPNQGASSRAAASGDPSPPTGPTFITAGAQSIFTLTAGWSGAADPDSGISEYIFGVGNVPSGDYSTLAGVRWWQATTSTSVNLSMSLDPNQTYYVSVYAVNGAGLSGPIITSNPVHPAFVPLGQSGNDMHLALATSGYDASGNPTTGWTAAQASTITTFFNQMYPILRQLYGPPALDYTVTVVRDLRYTNKAEFVPSELTIHTGDTFYPQLFTHELVHAFRNTYLLSSDQNWNYDPTLSGFEEGFAQAVSYEAMNRYVQTYPNDSIVPGNTLWGSSMDWDYDFQNVPELRGTDFWSDGGGTLLYWTRYEMAAAAIRKIELESPGFYAAFNAAYYARFNADPAHLRPSQALIVSIIKGIVPTIEGLPADTWIADQNIFYDQNVYGDKIFHWVQDYEYNDFFAFQRLYFLNTMACGSEWACYDGTQWRYYDLNGTTGTASLQDDGGNTIWSGTVQIQPTANPSDGNYAIGYAPKSLTTASTLQPWPGGNDSDYIENLTAFGLYRFTTTFTDPNTGQTASNSIYRVIGTPIAKNFSGVFGGIIGHKNGTIYIDHAGYANQPGLPVQNGAFYGARSWTGVRDLRTGGLDSIPGKVTITFVDSDTGATFHAQRNIDYGSVDGSQMFLFDFGAGDTTPPTVSVSAPVTGATVFGTTTLTASASDDSGVATVQFLVDGQAVGGHLTGAPYTFAWDSTSVADGTHTVQALAVDTAGNTKTSDPVSVTVANSPTVSLTSPAPNSAVSGIVAVAATASANAGITKVDFVLDGNVPLGTDTSSPYTVAWNTAGLAAGSSHSLSATVTAGNGRTATSVSVPVTISDTTAPSVSITAPANNSSTSASSATITANASDNVGVAKVEFYLDGKLISTDTTSPYSATWSPAATALGSHSLTAKAYDAAGTSTVSAAVTVKVVDTTAPTVSITAPANNSQVTHGTTVTIRATATDNRAVSKVDFSVNNALKCTRTAAAYTCSWSVPGQRGVKYTITAKATDSSGNTASSSVTVTSR